MTDEKRGEGLPEELAQHITGDEPIATEEAEVGWMPEGWEPGQPTAIPMPDIMSIQGQSVNIMENIDGQTRVTQAYHNLYAPDDEVCEREATDEENDTMGRAIAPYLHRNDVNGAEVIARNHVRPGVKYNFEAVRVSALCVAREDDTLNSESVMALEEVVSRLESEQRGDVLPPRPSWFHLGGEMIDETERGAYCNRGLVTRGFVSVERFEQSGPPANVQVCRDCVKKLEVDGDGELTLEEGVAAFVDQFTGKSAAKREQARLWRERESWASDHFGYPQNGLSFNCYFNDDGHMLALMDTGRTTGDGRSVVAYILCGPYLPNLPDGEDIIFEGQDLYPSPVQDDPVGNQAASDCIALLSAHNKNDPGLIPRQRGWLTDAGVQDEMSMWAQTLEEEDDDDDNDE
jgi:hypothetical protein